MCNLRGMLELVEARAVTVLNPLVDPGGKLKNLTRREDLTALSGL